MQSSAQEPEDCHTEQFPQLRTTESEDLHATDASETVEFTLFGGGISESRTAGDKDEFDDLAAALYADFASAAVTPEEAAAERLAIEEKDAEAAPESASAANAEGDTVLLSFDPKKADGVRNAMRLCAVLMLVFGVFLLGRAVSDRTQAVMLSLDDRVIGYAATADAQAIGDTYQTLRAEYAEGDGAQETFPVLMQELTYVAKDETLLSSGDISDILGAAVRGGYTDGYVLYAEDGRVLGYAATEADILAAEERATDLLTGRLLGNAVLPQDAEVSHIRTFTYVPETVLAKDLLSAEALLGVLCTGGQYDAEVTVYETVAERIPFGTTYKENDENFDGVTTLISPGFEGLAAVEYRVTLDSVTGEALSRTEHSRTVLRAATDAVAYKGSAFVPAGTGTGTYIWPLPDLPDDDLPLDENGEPYMPQNPFALKNTYVSSLYGERTLWGAYDFHLGLDIVAPVYTEIYACDGGVVTWASYTSSYGYMVTVQHENGVESLYAHQAKLAVKVGDTVRQGQLIGYVGASGTTSGTHLHLEFRYNHVATDPTAYVKIPDAVYVIGQTK